MKIIKPTFVVDRKKVTRNIERMRDKIGRAAAPVRFRPHFKTHQSAEVGEWFKGLGIESCTVSSVEMATYFADHGWRDITIAVLVNKLEIEKTIELLNIEDMNLELLLDSRGTVRFLEQKLQKAALRHNKRVSTWVKIDVGYHRTGIPAGRKEDIHAVVKSIGECGSLEFKGLLTHAGHSYKAVSIDEIKEIYTDTAVKMEEVRDYLKKHGTQKCEISIGDTPTASVVDVIYGADELRPGNFVYYDVMQLSLGSCRAEDIAAAAACPVIGSYSGRREVVVYGGAVHNSKEFVLSPNNEKIFGLVAMPREDGPGWGPVLEETYVSSLSQEHGIIKTTKKHYSRMRSADFLYILPVHACLTSNLLKHNTIFL